MKTTSSLGLNSTAEHDGSAWYYWFPVLLVTVGVFFIPFSPSINSLVAVTGLWCLCWPSLRSQLGRIARQPACWFALLFLLWIAVRFFGGVPMPWHLKLSQLKHAVALLVPVILLPVLFVQFRYRSLLWVAVLVAGTLIVMLQWMIVLSLHFAPAFYSSLSHLLSRLRLQPQQTAVFLAFTAYLYAVIAVGATDSKLIRGAASLFVLLIGLSMLMAQHERIGVVVYVLSLLFLVYRRFHWRAVLLLFVFFCLMASCLVLFKPHWINGRLRAVLHNAHSFVINRDNERLAPKTSVALRLYYLEHGSQLFLQKPLMGYGAGTFRGGESESVANPTFSNYHGTAENNFLTMALQLGLIGLVLFLGFLLSLWRLGARLPILERDILHGVMVVSIIAAMSFVAFGTNNISTLFAAVVASCLGSGWDRLVKRDN